MSDSIEDRLSKLEMKNTQLISSVRRMRQLLAVVSAVSLVVLGAGALQIPAEMRASKLSIIGPNGQARVGIGVINNEAEIQLFDQNGDSHIRLAVDGQGGQSYLKIRDINDNVRIDLGVVPQGNAAGLLINGIAK